MLIEKEMIMKMFRSSLGAAMPLAFVLAFAAQGCVNHEPDSADDATTNEAQAAETQAADSEALSPKGGRAMHLPMGPEVLVFSSLRELDLTNTQRAAVETIASSMHPEGRGDGSPPKEITALAASIRSGKVDASAVEPSADDMKAHMAEHRAQVVSALQKLHDTLTDEQRTALVASVEKRMAEAPPPGDRGPGDHDGPKGEKGPMGFLFEGIDLTDAQKTQIKAALDASRPERPSEDEMRSHMEAMKTQQKALLTAFGKSRFDASSALGSDEPGFGPHPMPKIGEAMAKIVPILTETQRGALADRILAGPPRDFHQRPRAAAAAVDD